MGEVFEDHGFQVITVDCEEKFQPTILTDILLWDYKNAFHLGVHFEVISCGPPCTEFSAAKTLGERNLELADKLVLKCLEIVEFFSRPFGSWKTPERAF